MEISQITEGLTFDDVLLVPAYSEILPADAIGCMTTMPHFVDVNGPEQCREQPIGRYRTHQVVDGACFHDLHARRHVVTIGEDHDGLRCADYAQ